MQVADELRALLGDAKVSTSESVLDLHAGDLSYHRGARPAVVSRVDRGRLPSSRGRTSTASLLPFGAGTSLEGHVIPPTGRSRSTSRA